jgi:uncharacterized membrane protein
MSVDKGDKPVKNCPFRWKYIIIPLSVLLLTVILAAVFYSKLPVEVACLFRGDGSPARLLGRGTFILWVLVLQLILTLAAGALSLGMALLSNRFMQTENTGINPAKIITLMSNMIAIPQVIIFFAMLDIFSYNSYQIHLLPLWLIAVIVLVVGGIVLSIFFIRAMLQMWRTSKE